MPTSKWQASLRWRFLLSVAVLVVAAAGAFGTLAYRIARASALEAARIRLQSVATQFAQMTAPSLSARAARLREMAADPAIARAFRSGVDTAVISPILRRAGGDTAQLVSVSLHDGSGRLMATIGQVPPVGPVPDLNPDGGGIGPLYRQGNTFYYDMSAPVRGPDGPLGYVRLVRVVRAPAAAIRQLTDLVGGPDVVLLIGNVDSTEWTDMVGIVHRPAHSEAGSVYERDGNRRIAASARVAGSPLVFAMEAPVAGVLAPVRAMTWRFVPLGLLLLVLGLAAAYWLSRTIIGPITELTTAAEAVAGADPASVALPTGRSDELGRLARSFRAMSDRVTSARETLEHQVADRTAELESALVRLEAAHQELITKERLATLGHLSSSVGHELRNPLGVMTNAVYFLKATLRDVPPKTADYLDILQTQIRTAEKIVSDLLDFARIRDPERQQVVMGGFIDEQIGRVRVPQDVEVRRIVPPDLPAAWVDPGQIGQIVLNLLTNAVQAMDTAGGTLTIDAAQANGRVRIQVADSGPGVPPENLDRIFEPLFTTKARGIGLGLSVSRALARANGGDLSVDSAPDQGARFTLILPAWEGP